MTQILDSIINKRMLLLNNTELKESIQDVLFLIEYFDRKVVDSNIYLLPYADFNLQEKDKIVNSIVSKITDYSFFSENRVQISNSNIFILSSYNPLNQLDSHYIFEVDKGIIRLMIYNLDFKLIIDKILDNKWILPETKIEKEFHYLFFDTETTGLPLNWHAPVSDIENWPRLVQLAYLCYDKEGNKILSGNHIIKPNNFTIPADVSKVHGISTERAIQEGESLKTVLEIFNSLVGKCETIVAHNISFDEKIINCEFIRNKIESNFHKKNKICTMNSTTAFCAIDGPYGYKWPKLSELHFKLFKSEFEDAHNALIDIEITAKCFWELKKLNQL